MDLRACRLSQEPEEPKFSAGRPEMHSQRVMPLSNERLSSADKGGDMDVDSAGSSGDEGMTAEDMDDVTEGFIGDFEEIDEDEEVQRFISLNLTPAASTHQSPTTLRPHLDLNGAAEGRADDSSDDDEDDSFESITERESGRLVGALVEPEVEEAQPVDVSADVIAKAVPDAGLYSKVSSAHMQRLRLLQDGFREKHTPKLESDMLFFSPEVYKRYTVLAKPAETVAEVAVSVAPALPETLAPPPVQQKRSSLRAGGDVSVPSVEQPSETVNDGGAATAADDNDLPVSARTRHATSCQEEDDVVGAILGVMSSPKSRTTNTLVQSSVAPRAAAASTPHDIPNDMLVAMMAIEGVDNAEVTSKLAAARNNAESAASKEPAARLPKGYTGPFSQLTLSEHRQFLELAQRLKAGVALSTKDNTDYQRLKPKVEVDQQSFRTQARERALPLLRVIGDNINRAALGELAGIGTEALKCYPPAYMPVRVTAIRASSAGYVPLVYKDTLLQRGACYHAEAPVLNGKTGVPVLSEGDGGERRPAVMSRDAVAMDLAVRTGADVAISSSALIALLTLPQSYNHETIIPFRVMESVGAQEDSPPRRVVVVDKPLLPSHTATPRKLNQMHYEAAVRRQLVDKSRPLDLAGGSLAKVPELAVLAAEQSGGEGAGQDNANYTLWEFGGLRMLIRYSVHGFAAKEAPAPSTTTVTLETKLEYQLGSTSAEAAMASTSGEAYEDISESERLAWWLGSYLRGSPSEVWVAHVDVHRAEIARMTRRTCADLYPGDSSSQPSTRGVLSVLQDLLRLNAGQYMLAHRRRTWDATIYRALDESESVAPQRAASEAVMSLAAELKPAPAPDLTQLGVEGDYVHVAWAGMPAQIPYTYAPADLPAIASSTLPKWKSGAATSPSAARKRRRAAAKLAKKPT